MKRKLIITLEDINIVAERVPYLAKIMPASDISMDDIFKAGGVQCNY